jgi:peptidoglycan/LPS O-acetylase OafA/YrhL
MPTDDRRTLAIALAADVVAVVVFCTIGRRSHAEGLTAAGVAETAWPFLAGAAVGWLAARGRRPFSLRPTGLLVWVCTVVVGMLLRKLTGQGVAPSFVLVAATVTAVFLLGWRGVVNALSRRRIQRG